MSRSVAHQPSSIISFSVISQIGTKIRIVPLIFLLLTAVPVWFVCEAIAPQIVRAYTARVDLAIDRLPEETYETVLRRAEAAARAAAQRSFDQDILVTDVSVIVSVQSQGAIAPVLALDVSRPQWRNRPDTQRWATYFKTARSLLFFEQNLTTVPALQNLTTPPPLQNLATPPATTENPITPPATENPTIPPPPVTENPTTPPASN
ncbi:hypothetical protein NIES37_42010 [Tolypothrix tenuis PCC 7101]|uniref:Uncharacterized protein n=1 Tax=Tolypothrix tenuis PCC 7101 TaxID=231146 RepID=A0A1Z4N3I6_9CYAN|nr:hypothetical protein NIES37_42010 [Tolypothrix tenuis PCC 7101]BAZ75867.1 hypothetical protein NIES50_44580 [Aulosira laxa NIES-50]